MRSPRLFVAIVVVLGMLLSSLGALTATAAPPDPDKQAPPEKIYQRPSERVLYDQRVHDRKVSGDLREARRHAAVNYAVVWWRITDYDDRTIERLKSISASDERYPWHATVDPSLVEIKVMTGEEMRRDNPELYEELRKQGLERGHRLEVKDVIAQMVARSVRHRKGRRGYHAEEILLRLRYEMEYFHQQLEKAKAAGQEIDEALIKRIEKDLKPRGRIEYNPKDLIYGVTEREPCSYPGSPACYRYSGLLDFLVPYNEKKERRAAQGELSRIIQDLALNDLALIIRRTYVRDAVTKALRPFQQPGEIPGRRYDYDKDDPRRDPPGLERALDLAFQDNGGIDFSSLELRYIAEDPSGKGIRYAFTGRPGGSPESQSALAGARSVNVTSDAFFVWLALPESSFWVNLNPNEPGRLLGDGLEKTDVGRIMLDADLQLKKTVGELIHPDTQLGKRFWNSLHGMGGELCFSHRVWITPKPAKIYDRNGELYILEAPLDVQMEQDYIRDVGTRKYRGCPYQPEAIEEHNADVYRRLVLPRLIEAVNNAPEYAALRQIYLSRIAAEWYRERSELHPMEFSDLIDSGDAGRRPSMNNWTPMDTYRRYVRSYTKGEFDTALYTFGGVVFTDVPKQEVTTAEFERSRPDTPGTVDNALHGLATDADSGRIWLGGTSAEPTQQRPHTQAKRAAPANDVAWLPVALPALAGVVLLLGLIVWRARRTREGRARSS